MKTMTEAAKHVLANGYLEANKDLRVEMTQDPTVMGILLTVACAEALTECKLMMALHIGIAIGIEMEKC